MTENLFNTVTTGDLLRCKSSPSAIYEQGKTYAVQGTVNKGGVRHRIHLKMDGVQSATWLNEPMFNASFERVEEVKDLFHRVKEGDTVQCISRDASLHLFAAEYKITHVVETSMGREVVYVTTKENVPRPWRNVKLFNERFELLADAVKPPETSLFFDVKDGDELVCVSANNSFTVGQRVSVEKARVNSNAARYVRIRTGADVTYTFYGLTDVELFNRIFALSEGDEPAASKENPKDLIGNTKLGLRHVPLGALYEMAVAMDDGARKYGPFNWRAHPVRADVYVDAAKRHMEAWVHGEERAGDSGGHHLAHAMACMAILLDAQHHGTLKDNRDPNAKNFYDIIDQIQKDRDAAKKVLDDEKQRM